jgi:hypothetical protein
VKRDSDRQFKCRCEKVFVHPNVLLRHRSTYAGGDKDEVNFGGSCVGPGGHGYDEEEGGGYVQQSQSDSMECYHMERENADENSFGIQFELKSV